MEAYQYAAAEWCKETNAYTGRQNWAELLARADAAYGTPKKTIMRNQLNIGFSNNYWPALSRWLIMAKPYLATKIHPRMSALDTPEEAASLVKLYTQITGKRPRVNYWKDAK